MKKILIPLLILLLPVFFIMMVCISVTQQFGQIISADFSGSDDAETGQCGYITSETIFDERTEEARKEFQNKLHPFYLNVALSLYQSDEALSVEDIVNEIGTWNTDYDVATNLQNYKYDHKYIDYLKATGEKHSLSVSRKYYNDYFIGTDKEKDKRAYVYYLDILSLTNENCKAVTSDGEYIPPLESPFVITQDFGISSIAGGTHFGVDVVKEYGAPVYAVTDAVVDKASNQCPSNTGYIGNMCNQGQGNYVQLMVVDNDKEIYITTMHMKSVDVKEGDTVSMGQKIGEQGNSGNTSGSHVHIEFRAVPYVSTHLSDFLDPHNYIDFYK